MSIEGSLKLLNIESLENLTAESLKRAFKAGAVQSHPDKGGKEGDFDKLLSAYLHLSSVLKRLTGGRDGLQSVLAVDEVEKARQAQFESEMNNMINDVFDSMHLAENDEWREKFNEAFEKHHVPHNNTKGYDDWFKKHDDDINDEALESATHSMPIDQWNQQFEKTIRHGKPPVQNYHGIMAFQQHMAYDNQYQNIGSALIERKDTTFTSYGWDRPAYTDLHAAYTTEHTILDKLPEYEPVVQSLDDLIAERNKVFDVKNDKELEALHAYEKGILDKEEQEKKENKERLAEYFKSASVSQWALRSESV
jgi:curved DNA-binding protein CbpA